MARSASLSRSVETRRIARLAAFPSTPQLRMIGPADNPDPAGPRSPGAGGGSRLIDAPRRRSYARPAAASFVDRHADQSDQSEEGPVSPSEFVFLACGLTLGLFAGGALIEVFRARPAARREVRVTVTAGPAGGRAHARAPMP